MADDKTTNDDILANITKTIDDLTGIPLNVPQNKLDADQYMADDLDGVTESLFGSGNMAYASLQASQTDEALAGSNITDMADSILLPAGGNGGAEQNTAALADDVSQTADNTQDTAINTGRPTEEQGSGNNTESFQAGGAFANSTIGSLGASQENVDGGIFRANGAEGSDGLAASDGADGSDGNSGQDGSDGIASGDDCNDCGPVNINIDSGDISQIIDSVFIGLGDTIGDLTVSITEVTDILNELIDTGDILELIDLDIVKNLLTDITGGLEDKVELTLAKLQGLLNKTLSLDVGALNTLQAGVDIPLDNILATNLDLDIDSEPLLNLLDGIGEQSGIEALGDTLGALSDATDTLQDTINQTTDIISNLDLADPAGSIGDITETLTTLDDTVTGLTDGVDTAVAETLDNLGILGGDNDGGTDSDITADLGIDALDTGIVDEGLDIALDPVEDITGDLDVDVGLNTDLLGGADSKTDNGAGDTEITIETDIDIVDNTLADITENIELDPIEDITGDIDLDIGTGIDLLGGQADPVVNDGDGGTGDDTILADAGDTLEDTVDSVIDGLLGGGGETDTDTANDNSWTETMLDDTAGGLFDDIIGGDDSAGALPEPGGTVGEGIGALDINPELDTSSLGGLFG